MFTRVFIIFWFFDFSKLMTRFGFCYHFFCSHLFCILDANTSTSFISTETKEMFLSSNLEDIMVRDVLSPSCYLTDDTWTLGQLICLPGVPYNA